MVLMDWHMPGMNGLEASRIIKRHDRLQNVPKIVMVTAFGREDVKTQAEQIGVEGYLVKPVSPSQLYDTLMDLFGITGVNDNLPRGKQADNRAYDATGIRALLVEDNEVNQQVATELLESAGAIVTIANHGGEAVKLLTELDKADSFDVVLMDLQMPEMDGFVATGLLRNDPRFQKLPIIAMTAHALVEERQRCLDVGMNDHIAKPIDPDALFDTLLRWAKPQLKCASAPQPVISMNAGETVRPQISGINVEDGLRRVAGNWRLYHNLLSQFAENQADVDAQISAALGSGDRKLAERFAHTVKGVAGNLGMTQLQLVAQELEKAIRDPQGSVPMHLEQFTIALRAQITAINKALDGSELVHSIGALPRPFDKERATIAIARLKALLESNDGAAPEASETLQAVVAGVVQRYQLDALSKSTSSFDFETALVNLEEIAQLVKKIDGQPNRG